MNVRFDVVEWNVENQMIFIIPRHRFFHQIIRRVVDEIMIDSIAQIAEVIENSKLNTTDVTIFE